MKAFGLVISFFILLFSTDCFSATTFTIISQRHYNQVFQSSRANLDAMIQILNQSPLVNQSLNDRVAWILKQFLDKPYLYAGATGEGDWQPGSWQYRGGAAHIQQDPVYRTDGFDCQTLVSVVIGLLHAKTLEQFDRNILMINYGAASGYSANQIHYFNRNHFISADFNSKLNRLGFLFPLNHDHEPAEITVNIARYAWFRRKKMSDAALKNTLKVFSPAIGQLMLSRFLGGYPPSGIKHFDNERVTVHYLSKLSLFKKVGDGYVANENAFDAIPTPSVIEFIRDSSRWDIGGKNIRDWIGSDLAVGHLGILYRQTFKRHALIYRNIQCEKNAGKKVCQVSPVYCMRSHCRVLMLVEATRLYPNGYYWYKTQGHYVCRDEKPAAGVSYSRCNRVEALPLKAYLLRKPYGWYEYLDDPSRLGLHIQTLSPSSH